MALPRSLKPKDAAAYRDTAVLVTGASGFLGAWLTTALLEAGARVVCVVRDEPRPTTQDLFGLGEKVTVVRGAIEDPNVVERALSEYEVQGVFHLAAQTLVGTARKSPATTFESNIRGTWVLLEACRRLGEQLKYVVVASSDKAYGVHEQLPYTEDFALRPTFPYDVSKACADLIARSYYHSYGVPVAVTRCANLYGGGDLNWSRIVPGTIRSALEGEPPVIRSDGTPVRDYLHVRDAASAYLALAAAVREERALGCAFNFGSDNPIAVLPLVKMILEACERHDLQPRIEATARGEIDRQYLDSTRARQELGWHPQISLEHGLVDTVRWYREFAFSDRKAAM